MKILGLSCFYHDSAAVLIDDESILAAAQEERFTRIKGDEAFPVNAIRFCLESSGTHFENIDAVVFYEKPLLTFERILENFLYVCPRGLVPFLAASNTWFGKKLNMRGYLKKEFRKHFGEQAKNIKLYFSEHHLSHASSAFFPSPFEEAAILCIDGVGEWATTSAWTGKGNQITPLWEIRYPHSQGLLYSAFTYYCGFKINSGEYKLMGLAPFGVPRFKKLIEDNLIRLHEDGSFSLNLNYFGYMDSMYATNDRFHKLFGAPPRLPEAEMTDFYKDMAASIQEVLNEAILHLAMKIKTDTGAKNLCLSGGVSLNCVANGLLAETNLFDHIWIQPAAGDAGGALGAALGYLYLHEKRGREVQVHDLMKGAYLGPSYSRTEILTALEEKGLKFEEKPLGDVLEWAGQQLAENKILGWYQGAMEYGPRALGARSILGNPLDAGMKSKMNMKIKFREGFRPFAPIVTSENYDQYFNLPQKNEYMLLVSSVKNPSLMPAITHVDDTARVQTVYHEKNPVLHRLLKEFAKHSGHPVLINTSFNVRGEPIVCTPENAIDCFINTDIDALVLENFIITKEMNQQLDPEKEWHAQFQLD